MPNVLAGTTSYPLPIFVQDSSSSSGAGLSGLVYNTSGLVCEWRKEGQSSWNTVTLLTGGTLGTYSSATIVADGSLAGAYELGVPNAALAGGAGVAWSEVRLYGATNMLPVLVRFDFAYDPLGVTVPGSYASGTAGYVLGTNLNATVSSRSTYSGGAVAGITGVTFPTNFSAFAISGGGAVTVGTNSDKTGYSLTTAPPTAAAIATAVWTDTTSGDFTTSGSPGKTLVGQLGGTFTTSSSSVFSTSSLANGATASLGSTAPANWINTAAFASDATIPACGTVLAFAGLFLPATVTAVGSATSFTVSFGSSYTAANAVGCYYCSLTGTLGNAKGLITGATQVDSTHVTLTFNSGTFPAAPSVSDTGTVG